MGTAHHGKDKESQEVLGCFRGRFYFYGGRCPPYLATQFGAWFELRAWGVGVDPGGDVRSMDAAVKPTWTY
ncbi:hypothetical protein GCM10007392_06120 [Saccharospirillum salsuginis]|uniref:Uncharacterized protein n=1 Tax=Saccharospirillum salsuginis TaxID=418750 RepID=A0A918N6X1_9GAMM|nr:hypothetical protein GCM10007392_06120 [Saccharospirillum salsuginis]